MQIKQIHDAWGTIVEFNDPMDFFKQDQNVWRDMIYARKLIIFKRMTFSLIDYMKLAHWFGQPWESDNYMYSHELAITQTDGNKTYVSSQFSNKLISTKRIGLEEMPWHADVPNRSYKPFPHRSLWIVKNPNPEFSGQTRWLNITLPECEKYLTPELHDLMHRTQVCQQSWYAAGTELQTFPLIKTHPITGERSLRLNYYCDSKKGVTGAWIKSVYVDNVLQPDCSLIQRYIDCLFQHSALVSQHQWDDYDVAIYDNYPFIHGRTALQLSENNTMLERKFYRTNIDHLDAEEWNEFIQKN